MGSLTSKAQQLSQPQVVYLPSEPSTPATPTPEQQADDARRKGLLERDRGRFGTIQTGFKGLLGLADMFGQRKTLLGE
jgi:hypothetical protein